MALASFAACPHDPPLVEGLATSGDESSTTRVDPPTGGETTASAACSDLLCADGFMLPCVDGVPGAPVECDGPCVDGVGCVDCEAGTTRCTEVGLERCDDAGVWVLQTACNAAQGFACDLDAGACTGPCQADVLANSGHLGCEFYAVSIAALIQGDEAFGVLVTNPGDEPATITAERPLWSGATVVVPPHASAEVFLPWAQHLLTAVDTSLAGEAAVHVQSDRPVAVVQHSPLIPGHSAEASLLIPVHAWGAAYRVASAASRFGFAGLYAVVSAADGVTVDLAPRSGVAVMPGDGVAADGTGSVLLDRGDVLQVLAAPDHDLTGTGVTADGPIAVLGGHACGQVPFDVPTCDHLEESMLPVVQLGRTHAIVPPLRADGGTRRDQVVRIIAAADLTALEFEPPQDISPMLVYAGDHIDVPPGDAAFVVTSSAPVLVAQYMLGLGWDSDDGAPSLTIAAPVERFRGAHTIPVAPHWSLTDVDVVAPVRAVVTLDGDPLTDWTPIGASGLAYAHVRLVPLGGTSHTLVGDVPIGATVYGPVGSPPNSTSYWHPAGHSFAPGR